MDMETLRSTLFELTAKCYQDNRLDDSYDPAPMLVALNEKNEIVICMICGEPGVLVPKMVAEIKPTMYGTALPSFVTRIEIDTQERKRVEAVLFSFETPTSSEMWMSDIHRGAETIMSPPTNMSEAGAQIGGRLAHLLHQHTQQ